MGEPALALAAQPAPLKIDLGCGAKAREGFLGCDQNQYGDVAFVFDIAKERWPFDDNSVDEAHAAHFVEHLTPVERCHFVNELWRVLKVGAQCTIITPYWCSSRALGDPTHAWPPVAEGWFYYLDKNWRMDQARHTDKQWLPWGFDCDFNTTWGYSLHESLAARNFEYQQYAAVNFKDSINDMIATVTKRGA